MQYQPSTPLACYYFVQSRGGSLRRSDSRSPTLHDYRDALPVSSAPAAAAGFEADALRAAHVLLIETEYAGGELRSPPASTERHCPCGAQPNTALAPQPQIT
ncbi:hypothetical protein MPC4_20266 [Methylocella tundrae]|uniref:Uncharacterized protein n=1 Tax=Methylocella tundrae TaxID=227605 RepID=A0A8B6M5K4_METTU|nr:hypothetical protein MPC1_2490002 [Methylocella tundrae]VTZ50056.1 hypothetical protein MPC4_20266 [Methylocella tundrae]